jgi:hypothetical protein
VIAKEAEPNANAELEKSLEEVFRVTSDVRSDRNSILSTATKSVTAVDGLVDRFHAHSFDAQDAQRILQALNSESEKIARLGPKSAEQATMALQSIAAINGNPDRRQFEAVLKNLYKEIENPSSYNATQFGEQFRRAISTLR